MLIKSYKIQEWLKKNVKVAQKDIKQSCEFWTLIYTLIQLISNNKSQRFRTQYPLIMNNLPE